jgi:hypothetical protein
MKILLFLILLQQVPTIVTQRENPNSKTVNKMPQSNRYYSYLPKDFFKVQVKGSYNSVETIVENGKVVMVKYFRKTECNKYLVGIEFIVYDEIYWKNTE